jgi:MscS family membrane protein
VKNLLSGVFILVEKRFRPGERIKVEGVVEGVVEAIGFRSVTVRQGDRSPVYVPNALFSDNSVTNFSRMTHRHVNMVIGLEYRTSIEQLKYVRDEIEAYLWVSDDFAEPPEGPIAVYIENLNESSIDIKIVCFTIATTWDDWMAAKERLNFRIMEIVKAAGTDFAFPSRTLYTQPVVAPQPSALPAPSDAVAQARVLKEKRFPPQPLRADLDHD